MKFEKLIIHGFGTWNRRFELEFDTSSATVIIGRNEAGKSTLLAAISATLFGHRDAAQRKRYEPWAEHERYAAELIVRTEAGTRLKIARDFRNEHVQVHELEGDRELLRFEGPADPRSREASTANYLDLLAEVIGLKDEAVFRQTVYFEQQNLETAISDQIRRMVSGSATMDYRAVQHELHRRYAELTTDNPWRARRSEPRATDAGGLVDQEARLAAARTALARTLELESTVQRMVVEQRELDSAQAHLDQELDAHERLLPLLEREGSAARRIAELSELRDRREAQAQRVREIETYARQRYGHLSRAPSALPELIKSWREATRSGLRAAEELARRERERQELKPRWNLQVGIGAAAGGLALAILIGSLSSGAMSTAAFALAPLLGAAGFLVGRTVGASVALERKALEERCQALRAEEAQATKRAREDLGRCGPAVVGRAPEEVLADFTAFETLREERRVLLAALQAMGDKQVIDQRFDEALRERARVETALEELRAKVPTLPKDGALRPLETRIAELREERERHTLRTRDGQRRLADLRVELASLSSRVEGNLAVLSDGVRHSRERLTELDLERDALKLSIDTLDACVAEFQELDLEGLEEETSRIFRAITGERYSHVALETSLEPKVRLGAATERVSPESLSQGARDQLYFALRVAMGSHISNDIRLPLLLDDPFVNFDRERRNLARGILAALPDHQVILMSCHADHKDFGGRVIELSGQSAEHAAEA